MWSAWTVVFVCGVVGLTQAATLKDNDPGTRAAAEDSVRVQRESISTTYRPFFDWNNIADNIINLAKMDLMQQDKTTISLPDVHEEDSVSFGFFSVPYVLRASEGTVGDLSSFRRGGDVLLTKNSRETLRGDVPIASDRLVVRYARYNLKVIGLDIAGELEGTMDAISFLMTIDGRETELGCTTTLTGVKITDLGKPKVNVTGLGGVNAITSNILVWFLEAGWLGVMSTIESVLLQELRVIFQEYECDQLHSVFLLAGN